jgi:hypothetical protein
VAVNQRRNLAGIAWSRWRLYHDMFLVLATTGSLQHINLLA